MASGFYSYPKSETVADRKIKIANYISKMAEKGIVFSPVTIEGAKIAKKWWGINWCKNLERYSDFSNRLPRGKSYCKNGNVIDLIIEKGVIKALVMGSSKTPYVIEVDIDPLSPSVSQELASLCTRRIQNIESLVNGEFPKDLEETFFQEGKLFPTPKQIHFWCKCPDSASMCKHIAAVLYGVGAKLDVNPSLFFQLRGIDINSFIGTAITNKVEAMIQNAENVTSRIYDDADVSGLFGI